MNITLQTQKLNNQYQTRNNSSLNRMSKVSQPTFTGYGEIPKTSNFLKPIKKGIDSSTDWLARNYGLNLYTSKVANFLSSKAGKLDSVVDHMQVLGSIIISGMYMLQTLSNKDFDERRKQTLAINQGLTFLLSTACGYLIDNKLNSKWEEFTQKYASKDLDDPNLSKKIEAINDQKRKEVMDKLGVDSYDKVPKKSRIKPCDTLNYIERHLELPAMRKEELVQRIKGMGVLKKLVVFGTVYRFLGPVAVTPVANWIGNKLAENKNTKNVA